MEPFGRDSGPPVQDSFKVLSLEQTALVLLVQARQVRDSPQLRRVAAFRFQPFGREELPSAKQRFVTEVKRSVGRKALFERRQKKVAVVLLESTNNPSDFLHGRTSRSLDLLHSGAAAGNLAVGRDVQCEPCAFVGGELDLAIRLEGKRIFLLLGVWLRGGDWSAGSGIGFGPGVRDVWGGEERSMGRNVDGRPEKWRQSRGAGAVQQGRQHTGSVPCLEDRAGGVVANFPPAGLMRCPDATEPDRGRETVASE